MADQKAPSGKSQRRLKNYLLDLRYQLKFTLTMVVIASALTATLGYFIKKNASEATQVITVQLLDPTMTPDQTAAAKELQTQLIKADALVVYELIGFGFVLSLVLTIYGIVLTHKVAGPLKKVSLHLDKIRDGKLGVVYNLRKGDELVEFFEHFKAAHDALRKQEEGDIALLQKASESLPSGAQALKDEIASVVAQKIESLK